MWFYMNEMIIIMTSLGKYPSHVIGEEEGVSFPFCTFPSLPINIPSEWQALHTGYVTYLRGSLHDSEVLRGQSALCFSDGDSFPYLEQPHRTPVSRKLVLVVRNQ